MKRKFCLGNVPSAIFSWVCVIGCGEVKVSTPMRVSAVSIVSNCRVKCMCWTQSPTVFEDREARGRTFYAIRKNFKGPERLKVQRRNVRFTNFRFNRDGANLHLSGGVNER